jgi:hypothetical protein
MYEVIGEPPDMGAVHEMCTSSPNTTVTGSLGLYGIYAAKMITWSEYAERPYELRAAIWNVYVSPITKPIAVYDYCLTAEVKTVNSVSGSCLY